MGVLDFIVGGIPRAGTTAFADALNRHPDICCYAAETHLLPFAADIAGPAPVATSAIPQVRDELRRIMQVNLVEMVDFNLAMGSPDPQIRFGETDIEALATRLTRPADLAAAGPAYARQLSVTLARELRTRSGKAIVGEKTPTNILAAERIGLTPRSPTAGAVFAVVRKPFPVIRSMRQRLRNRADSFAAGFAGDTVQQAGFFVRHALASARLARAGAQLHRFETLSGHPQSVYRKVLASLGLPANDRIVHGIAQGIGSHNHGCARATFSAADQAIIDAITGPALDRLGYARDPHNRAADFAAEHGWRVIAGGHSDGFLEQRSVLMIVAEPQHRHAWLRFWHQFPASVVRAADPVAWSVLAMDGRELARASSPGPGPAMVELCIPLDERQRCRNGNHLVLVELACSHAFVPLAHPLDPAQPSPDVRSLAGQLAGVSFA